MDRTTQKPAFIAANEKALEQEAARQGNTTTAAPTTTTTTLAGTTTTTTQQNAPTTTTTTKAPGSDGGGPTSTTTTLAGTTTTTTQAAVQQQQVSDEALLTHMRKLTGNDSLTMDEMLAAVNKPANLTDEQKKKLEQQQEMQLQAAFVNSGKGTIDDFHRIRQSKNIKDEDLVRESFFAEAKELDSTLTDKDLTEMFNDMYFIGDAGAFSDQQMKIGQKRLTDQAKSLREQLGLPLAQAQEELQMNDDAIKSAKEWEKRSSEFVSQLPKTMDIPIGKVGNIELGNFTYNFDDVEQREIADALKDPAFLLKQIADEKTGKTDLSKLYNLVLSNKVLAKAVKIAAGEFYNKGVDSVTSLLDNRPNLTGTGNRENTDTVEERQKGEQIAKDDANRTFGRGPVTKSIK